MRIGEAVKNAELALVQLRAIAARHPELTLKRNPVGNYSIARRLPGYVEDWGYVDIFNEGAVLEDGWELE